MKYILTPEFHRNLWTKISPFKLVAAPVFIGLCVAVLLNIAPEKGGFFNEAHAAQLMMEGAWWIFFLVVAVWGIHDASTALQDEMRNNTWDFQRMSSVTPFQLVIGKLFGATSYAWYVGLIALVPFYYGMENTLLPVFSHPYEGGGGPWFVILLMVLGGLAGQALAFLISFIDMTSFAARTGKKRVPRAVLPFSFGVVVAWCVFFLSENATAKLSPRESIFRNMTTIEWYGDVYHAGTFILCSIVVFIGWFLLGSYRIARGELMYRTWPVCWVGFVAFLLFYLYGLVDPDTAYSHLRVMGLFVLASFLTYGVMLFEASDGRRYARFAESVGQGSYLRAFEDVHKWVVTVPFVALMFALTLLSVPEAGSKCISPGMIAGFMTAVLCFALRDGLVIHAMIRSPGRNIAFKAMFYYVCMYLVIPALHIAVIPKDLDFKAMRWISRTLSCRWSEVELPDYITALAFYYPLPMPRVTDTLVPALLQAVAAAALFGWSFRKSGLRKHAAD